ncbi:MAG TPA: PfkB family carbohydrate kinase, partial [Phycisphaerales bacterium]|nr:PfkB family carbohydrate kinase [Phycisphaerales bacterium]
MDLLCPSESEIRDALHDYDEGLSAITWRLLSHTQSNAALATLGEDGLIAFSRTEDSNLNPSDWRSRLNALHVPAFSPFAVDQLGCGDALLAAATLALSVNKSIGHAALLGSLAASCEAQHLGNAVISAADIRRAARRLCSTQLAVRSESLALTQLA